MGHNFLTDMQERFCQYRADGKKQIVAYEMAGYSVKDRERSSRDASLLESSPKVAQRIAEIKRERAEASKPEREVVERVQMDIVNSEAEWFWKQDAETGAWRMRKPYELSQRAWNCVKRVTKSGYEFHSKLDAIKILAGMCGWNSIQVKQQTDSVLKFDTLYFGLPDEMTSDAGGQ